MSAIFRRELRSYFTSPIAYVYLSVFYVFSGIFFYFTCIGPMAANISSVFSGMFSIVLFILPLLTMRLFSEDRKNKTDQALLTAPVGTGSIVMGKFFAAFTVFCTTVAIFIVYALVIGIYASLEWGLFFCNLIGLLAMGASLIAIGSFISALTENQVIAAAGAFGVSLLLSFLDSVASAIPNEWGQALLKSLSYMTRYETFSQGIFDISNVLFFLTVTGLFLFYTARSIDRRRYAG